ncbi:MAG: hypothetical protein RR162_09890 [Oscillospiraceae bacterium]
MQICDSCGAVMEDKQIGTYKERYPYGETYTEQEVPNECVCGGDFVSAHKCVICRKWKAESDLTDSVCGSCVPEVFRLFNEFLLGLEVEQAEYLKEHIEEVL